MWVIVDRLTKSTHFLAVRMTFTLEEFRRIYSRDCSATWSTSVHSIGHKSQVYDTLLEELPKGHGDTVDDEHRFSSTDRWSVGEDHIS